MRLLFKMKIPVKRNHQKEKVLMALSLTSIASLLMFMNCSFLGGEESSEYPSNRAADRPGDTVLPDPDPPDPDKDIDDPGVEVPPGDEGPPGGEPIVGKWPETSKITKIEIKKNGQICIDHTQLGQWPSLSLPNMDVKVEGNPWILVKLNDDESVAATYDYMREGEACHTLDAENIKNLYDYRWVPNKRLSLGRRTEASKLENLVLRSGDVIGLMVSGLVKKRLPAGHAGNIRERSELVLVKLPSTKGNGCVFNFEASDNFDGSECSQDENCKENCCCEIVRSCSEDPNSEACPGRCNIPNEQERVVDMTRQQYEEEFNTFFKHHQNTITDQAQHTNENWRFMDRVVQILQKGSGGDPNWGYACTGNCATVEEVETDRIAYKCLINNQAIVRTVQIIHGKGTTTWQASPDPAESSTDSTTSTTTGRSGSNDESSEVGTGVRGVEDAFFMQSSSSGATPQASVNKYGWIYTRPRPPGQPSIPYYPGCGTSAANGCVPVSSSSPTSTASSSEEGEEDVNATCTQEQILAGYATPVGGSQCLPRCMVFEKTTAKALLVETQTGDYCDVDRQTWNVLEIKGAVEDKCCRRAYKRDCPPGYKYVSSAGECYPTCATAAKLAGWTGQQQYLEDNDDLHNNMCPSRLDACYTKDCEDLDHYGRTDWHDFTFYDPFKFKLSSNTTDVHEVKTESDHHCCIRGSRNHNRQPPYDTQGWHPQDRQDLLPGPTP